MGSAAWLVGALEAATLLAVFLLRPLRASATAVAMEGCRLDTTEEVTEDTEGEEEKLVRRVAGAGAEVRKAVGVDLKEVVAEREEVETGEEREEVEMAEEVREEVEGPVREARASWMAGPSCARTSPTTWAGGKVCFDIFKNLIILDKTYYFETFRQYPEFSNTQGF